MLNSPMASESVPGLTRSMHASLSHGESGYRSVEVGVSPAALHYGQSVACGLSLDRVCDAHSID